MKKLIFGSMLCSAMMMVGCSADAVADNSKRSQGGDAKEEKIDPAEAKRRADAAALEAKRNAEEASYKDGVKDDALLFHTMLRLGIVPTDAIEYKTIEGNKVACVGGVRLADDGTEVQSALHAQVFGDAQDD